VAFLFISAGRLDWTMAWVYIGALAVGVTVRTLILVRNNPELIVERTRTKEDAKDWDRVLASLMAVVGPAFTWIVAGVDMRFAWSPGVPLLLQIAALAFAMLGDGLLTWAMTSNRFFSGVFRIQSDRGHTVATAGPYRAVRHPGYVGAMLFTLATPLVLGSLWALIPAGLTACIIVLRTALEDRTLQEELDGYRDYTRWVRHRLLPGIW
jgi:protein-S-isoprenylcysteine O-methyltransferase Ste14